MLVFSLLSNGGLLRRFIFDYQFGRTRSTAKVVYLRSLSEKYNMNSDAGEAYIIFGEI